MKFFVIILLLLSLFDRGLSYSQFLEKKLFIWKLDVNVYQNMIDDVKFNLVEIFNPFQCFNYKDKLGITTCINQLTAIFKNENKVNIITVYGSNNYVTEVWVRIINITDIVPGGGTLSPDVSINENDWSTSLTINGAGISVYRDLQISVLYHLYVLPVYPGGNIHTWSNDYRNIRDNKEVIMFDAINKSIEMEYLTQNAQLLHTIKQMSGPVNFTLARRINRDFLLFIVAQGPNSAMVQYPPVYISGCLTRYKNDSCPLLELSYPMYIVLGLAIIFIIFSIKYDIIQVFICCYIFVAFVTFISWRLISHKDFENRTLQVVSFGIAPVLGLICVVIWSNSTKKFGRLRMIFTAFVVSLILLSIFWFKPVGFVMIKSFLLFGVISIVALLVLGLLLCLFNHLTLTMGSVFVGAVLISLSVSINNLNGSVVPYIFLDFYNSIIFSYPDWIYYTPLLNDDLIIVVVCPVLSFIVGLICYIMFKKSLRKKERQRISPQQRFDSYGSIGFNASHVPALTRNIVVVEQTNNRPLPSEPPPRINYLYPTPPNVSSASEFQGPPPNYESCLHTTAAPSAPAPDYYDIPHSRKC